jgi:hypothetical protein
MKDETKVICLIGLNFLVDVLSLIGGIMLIETTAYGWGFPVTGLILAMGYGAFYSIRSVQVWNLFVPKLMAKFPEAF